MRERNRSAERGPLGIAGFAPPLNDANQSPDRASMLHASTESEIRRASSRVEPEVLIGLLLRGSAARRPGSPAAARKELRAGRRFALERNSLRRGVRAPGAPRLVPVKGPIRSTTPWTIRPPRARRLFRPRGRPGATLRI